MSIKAIFFDIDGTLVPFGDRGIPAEVREAIRQVRADGVKVFIATGRHPEWIDNLGDTEFDGYVTTNGALVLLADKRTLRACLKTIVNGSEFPESNYHSSHHEHFIGRICCFLVISA